MRYLIRAIKYFVYMAFILALVLLILSKMKMVGGDLDSMFVDGKASLGKIAALLAIFSAINPKLSYSTRKARMYGPQETFRQGIEEVMEDHGYRLEKEDEEGISFIKRSPFDRLTRLYEDRVTLTPVLGGFDVSGRTKDTVRLISALEYKFREIQEGE